MLENKWFKKESPLQGLSGLWGGLVSNLSGGAGSAYYQASGGTESTVTEASPNGPQVSYKLHKFTSPGNLVVTASANGSVAGAERMEVLMVGGGGGGGVLGGGGGGGGVVYAHKQSVDASTYAVGVGTGGLGDHGWGQRKRNGSPSTFAGIQVYGGGFGSSYSSNGMPTASKQAISANGGGNSPHGDSNQGVSDAQMGGWTRLNQSSGNGFQGGTAPTGCCPCTGGGGAGAAFAGTSAPNGGRGPGGPGYGPFSKFAGQGDYVAGGGGNNGYCGPGGPWGGHGGTGGGGGGGSQDQIPDGGGGGGQAYGGGAGAGAPGANTPGPGTDGGQGGNGGTNTGGGGGAGASGNGFEYIHGGEGASGICLIRYIPEP